MKNTFKYSIITSSLISLFGCGGAGGDESTVKAMTENIAPVVCSPNKISSAMSIRFHSVDQKSWGFGYVNTPIRLGKQSQRFELRQGDCGGHDCEIDRERSEVIMNPQIDVGQRKFIAYSIYLDPSYKDSDSRVPHYMLQIQHKDGPYGVLNGSPSQPPLIMMKESGGIYNVCVNQFTGPFNDIKSECIDYNIGLTTANMRGKWTDIILDLNTSKTTGGLTIYVNGREKLKIDKPIVSEHDPSYFYVRYGVYRSWVSRLPSHPTQIVYYDEVRMGNSMSEVDNRCDLNPVD